MPEDDSFPLMSGIDIWGTTILNRFQMPRFIKELTGRLDGLKPGPERRAAESVLALARQCEDSVHTFLIFYGD